MHFPGAVAVFATLKLDEGFDETEDLTVQLQVNVKDKYQKFFEEGLNFHQVSDHGQIRRSGNFGKLVAVQWPRTGSHQILFISIVSFLSTKGLPSSSALSSKFEPTALATNRLAISHSGGEEGKDFSFDAFTIS